MAPVVYTSEATGITFSTVTLNGNLASLGSAATVNVSLEYGLDTSYGTTLAAGAMTTTGTFSFNVIGLSPGTTYHFRAKADGGATPGADMTFTTTPITIVVETLSASAINTNTATLNGKIVSLGSASTVKVYFEYGTTTSYGSTVDGTPASRTSPGTFIANLAGLNPGIMYHFRAKAEGGGQTVFGADTTFTTTTDLPVVATNATTDVSFTTATLRGALTSRGAAPRSRYCLTGG